jgi:hypothetical protein
MEDATALDRCDPLRSFRGRFLLPDGVINPSISKVTFTRHIEGRVFEKRSISFLGSFAGYAWRILPWF